MLSANWQKLDESFSDFTTNEMVVDLDMLHFFMEDRIVSNVNCILVITKNQG